MHSPSSFLPSSLLSHPCLTPPFCRVFPAMPRSARTPRSVCRSAYRSSFHSSRVKVSVCACVRVCVCVAVRLPSSLPPRVRLHGAWRVAGCRVEHPPSLPSPLLLSLPPTLPHSSTLSLSLTHSSAPPASDRCQTEKRKTINGDDLLYAMSTLGFERYVEPLTVYLKKYREVSRSSRGVSVDSLFVDLDTR
jgi:hypothetical protein